MKPFLVLLLPLVLVGCGPEPAPDAPVTSPTTPADAVAAVEKLGGEFVLDPKSG